MLTRTDRIKFFLCIFSSSLFGFSPNDVKANNNFSLQKTLGTKPEKRYIFSVEQNGDLVIFDVKTSQVMRFANVDREATAIIKIPLETPIPVIDENLQSKEKVMEALLEKAQNNYEGGQLLDALQALEQANKIIKNSPRILKMLGSVYIELKLPEKALFYYQKSLEQDPMQDDVKEAIKRIKAK
jgi:tetratricopeptide (TPR) repeat protein